MTLLVEQLSFERNFQRLLHGIQFELKAGELLQIEGANGSGKSTLLRLLAGLIESEEGKILWCGKSISDSREAYQEQMNYVGHQNGVRLQLTVAENLAYFLALNKQSGTTLDTATSRGTTRELINSNIRTSLDTTDSPIASSMKQLISAGLDEKKLAIHLSAGQKRRLALARLTLKPASLWILDEPTTALDVAGQADFFNLLKKHLAIGGMAILTSHHELLSDLPHQKIHLGGQHA